jgi:threonyl-tRNA synthetase
MSDIRALIDDRNEKIGRKIRDSEIKKIPFMIIIGEKEVKEKVLSIRRHGHGDIGTFKIVDFCKLVQKEVENALNAFE